MPQYSELQKQVDELRLALDLITDCSALLAETRKSYASNLTGPITSVGNATSVAAQTGTGETFVMQASPALTTPNIGAATGTSLTTSSYVSAAGSAGFLSTTVVANARNPIWRFGDADGYGFSYFQGTAGIGGVDVIGIHFGTATAAASSLRIRQDGIYVDGTTNTVGYTVAALPAGTVGMRAYVTDATAPTYNAALVGGGAITVPAFYNGAAWVSA